MFYDERIELVRGKISRNCIIISVIIACFFGLLRAFNIAIFAGSKYFIYVALEFVTILSGGIILLIGIIRYLINNNDERFSASQSKYYVKSGIVHLFIVLFAVAVFVPVTTILPPPISEAGYVDVRSRGFLAITFFTAGTYCCYSFKKNEIYFNYSIIGEERYYRKVFLNYCKSSLIILIMICLSFASLFLTWNSINRYTVDEFLIQLAVFAILYAVVFAILLLVYLLYSFLEKKSYDNEDNGISISTVVSFIVYTVIYAAYTAVLVVFNFLNFESFLQQFEAIGILNYFSKYAITFALLVFVTYFNYELRKSKDSKLFAIACLILIFTEIFEVIINYTFVCLTNFFIHFSGTSPVMFILSNISNTIVIAICITKLTSAILMIISLIKSGIIGKANYAVIPLIVLGFGLYIFSRTQFEMPIHEGIFSVEISLLLIYFSVLLFMTYHRLKRKQLNP